MSDDAAAKPVKHKVDYVGAPTIFVLNQMSTLVAKALGENCVYLVGSAIERPDFRDVDLRVMMADEKFKRLFGDSSFQMQPFWILLCTGVSAWFRERTGLKVDFQIQPMSHANSVHQGQRHPLGITYVDWRPPWFGEGDP